MLLECPLEIEGTHTHCFGKLIQRGSLLACFDTAFDKCRRPEGACGLTHNARFECFVWCASLARSIAGFLCLLASSEVLDVYPHRPTRGAGWATVWDEGEHNQFRSVQDRFDGCSQIFVLVTPYQNVLTARGSLETTAAQYASPAAKSTEASSSSEVLPPAVGVGRAAGVACSAGKIGPVTFAWDSSYRRYSSSVGRVRSSGVASPGDAEGWKKDD